MLYLMTVLTFLAGILFYVLSPTDDHLQQATHQAEPMIQDFLTQHQAAKDYFRTWYGANLTDLSAATYFNINPTFIEHAPRLNMPDDAMCENNAGEYPPVGDECFISRVICTNSSGTTMVNCSTNDANSYIVTYGGWGPVDSKGDPTRPGWWPSKSQRSRRYEKWCRAMTARTHGSLTCGTLFQHPTTADPTINEWCLDNGQTPLKENECAKVIPAGVIQGLVNTNDYYLGDMLLCMSYLKQGPETYYPYGLKGFWDGLDNQAKHAPSDAPTFTATRKSSGATEMWQDLISGKKAGDLDNSTLATAGVQYSEGPYIEMQDSSSVLTFPIQPASNQDFTITVLAGVSNQNKIGLISFGDNAESGDGLHVYYDYGTMKLVLRSSDLSSFTFENTMTLNTGEPVSVSLVYSDKQLSLFLGNKKIFESATITDTALSSLINTILNQKMQIKKYDANASCHIYGVRYFDRALSDSEVSGVFKEDTNRYALSIPSGITTATGRTTITLSSP